VIDQETVDAYIQRAQELGPPHGPDHDCFMDATIRKALGHRPLIGASVLDETVITAARPPMHTVEIPRGVRIAATRIGCTIAEYFRRQHDGERWCPRCQDWRADWRSAEGRTPYCHPCFREYRRAHYQSLVARAAQPLKRRVYGVAFAGPSFSKRRAS
jgi:hypothetical protein